MSATLERPRAAADSLAEFNERVLAREAEDRAVHTGEGFDIRTLAVETMRRGYMGFTVLLTGNKSKGLPYVAAFLTYQGRTIENTFSEYATPDAALAALLSQSRVK